MRHAFVLVFSLVLVSHSNLSQAADRFWIDTSGGSFTDSGNWSTTTGGAGGATAPTTGDAAIFDQSGGYGVTLSENAASDLLQIEDGVISFSSSGGTHSYDLTTGVADLFVTGGQLSAIGTNFDVGDDFAVTDAAFFANNGSDVAVGDRVSIATSGGDAAAIFDNSTFNFGGVVRMGLSGFDAGLTVQNSSIGTIGGDLDFARSGTLGSGGTINVNSNSTLTTNGRVLLGDIISGAAPNPATDYNTFITVDGGTFTMNGANNLRVGDSQFDNVNAELTVRNSGAFSSGIGGGNTIVQRTGLLTLESGGTFHARNDLLVTQGAQVTATGGAVLDAQQLFAIQSGSSASLTDADLTAANIEIGIDDSDASMTVSGFQADVTQSSGSTLQVGAFGSATATLTISGGADFTTGFGGVTTVNETGEINLNGGDLMVHGDLNVVGGSVVQQPGSSFFTLFDDMTVSDGGSVTLSQTLDIGSDATLQIVSGADVQASRSEVGDVGAGDGTLIVDGPGSTLTATLGPTQWGGGNSSSVFFRDDAVGTLGDVAMTNGNSANETSTLLVEDGAFLSVGSLDVGAAGAAGSMTTVDVTGDSTLLDLSGAATLTVGHASGGSAEVTVEDQSALIRTGTGLTTINATGTINVNSGGAFRARGNVLVDGGTLNSTVNNGLALPANGTLNATNNGQVNLTQYQVSDNLLVLIQSGADLVNTGVLGIAPKAGGGGGFVTVENLGSSITSTSTSVGRVGNTATLTIQDQATGTLGNVVVAETGVQISQPTTGTLNILSDATVTTDDVNVASGVGDATGVLNLNGVNSTLTQNGAATFVVGHATDGAAAVNLAQGGSVTSGTGAVTVNETGVFNISGGALPGDTSGTFIANGPMTVRGEVNIPVLDNGPTDPGGVLEINAGLTIDGGSVTLEKGVLDADDINLVNLGNFSFTGGTLHTAEFTGHLRNQGGRFAPGRPSVNNGVGQTDISAGDLDLQDGELEIEIGGPDSADDADFLLVALDARLGGNLEVELTNGYLPAASDFFVIMNAERILFNFDNVFSGGRISTTGGEGSFLMTISQSASRGQITLTDFLTPFSADFDNDGDVDAEDLAQWESDYGNNGNSDADDDGDSDGADFLAWQQQFGGGVTPLSTSQGVPEPGASILLIVALWLISCSRLASRAMSSHSPLIYCLP